ncbi:helix-turn-helix transcriptional regulator [Pseudomonas sp. RIT412]|uniref:helix-turn-helix domain-containing protein n=2 Tax=unclassified Pseudomonas TaxID=196821 RepID=UPI000D3B26A1|nr:MULTISPECIES: helix-turn-helix transcriptional regulator [unclassified Pseudomonas]RAU46633.1 XRE family transcriptional regulator [Pseudomonas sp. RIT 409]RAU52591.1 XRE family transcriptional regulator [Pseudomonas sp. RIT 412]
MTSKSDFGAALREVRLLKQLPQESLGPSQSFISAVERGIRNPTLEKFEQIAELLGVHPVTLLAYVSVRDGYSVEALLARIRQELQDLGR